MTPIDRYGRRPLTLVTAVALCGVASCTAVSSDGEPAGVTPTQAVTSAPQTPAATNPNYVPIVDASHIVRDAASIGAKRSKYFAKMISYTVPSGKTIPLYASSAVSDAQLLYAYEVLHFYLSNLDAVVANRMADNGAELSMPDGADGNSSVSKSALSGQDLYSQEVAPVGSAWYLTNDYEHRDAAWEEIFHMVHDNGIGTTHNPGADPALSKRIAAAQVHALPNDKNQWGSSGLWGLKSKKWLKELAAEGSLEQEYIVSVIDSYYGMWAGYTESPGGMWGIYVAKDRAEIKAKDPQGYAVVTSFLPPMITTFFGVDPSMTGTFVMRRDASLPYTVKSQYLTKVYLNGTNNSSLLGNDSDNVLMGNAGNNTLDGGGGTNVVQLRGPRADYTVATEGDVTTVTDSVAGRDGTDTIRNVAVLRFTDTDVSLPTTR